MTSRFIRLQCPLLLSPAKRSPLDRELHRWQSTRSPHILAIDELYNGVIAINVGSLFVASIDILFKIFLVEKDTRNGMATWYASYVPLSTVAPLFFQVHSETLQPILHFKLGTTSLKH